MSKGRIQKRNLRIHNEWFQPLVKTTCPCGWKGVSCYAWGEYVNAKWRTVEHFCRECFEARVLKRLISHASECGCIFQVQARSGYSIPTWIQIPQKECAA
jgi:hypothetical protein